MDQEWESGVAGTGEAAGAGSGDVPEGRAGWLKPFQQKSSTKPTQESLDRLQRIVDELLSRET